ncbi:YheT family hydrolase [Psychrobacter sp. FDAARGOS_221]|uniref:YheT family hydrolase n=1 Tax=Psychrobacter sp. FDAARGOS_221 TaxID=1975705 RepID=UPI000BB5598C|nr:alpha/beta fold hydrolase [Psychrobacter sp. FDAARGOS_221]PNK60810.1 alpha/beta hydrolase [Psychrobacter sp. FDAARGOS_221]
MPTPIPFIPAAFDPPIWLRNPHLQTILPKYIMPEPPPYRRDLVLDSRDESEVAYDFIDATNINNAADTLPASTQRSSTPLVVLFHGMEGSSQSHYARTLSKFVHQQGWHFVVAHTRSCGGVDAKGPLLYSAGDTIETHHALQHLSQYYETIYAVGISLGGNTLAKYMGEYAQQAVCDAATILSAPLDLSSAATAMENFLGRKIYTPYLLNPIVSKALAQQLTEEEIQHIKASRNIGEFDRVFTAPRYGYRSENDYYHKASAMPYLHNIAKPTLIINAQDDPFVGVIPSPGDISEQVTLYQPKYGGHIGFIRWKNKKLDASWFPETTLQFFQRLQGQ